MDDNVLEYHGWVVESFCMYFQERPAVSAWAVTWGDVTAVAGHGSVKWENANELFVECRWTQLILTEFCHFSTYHKILFSLYESGPCFLVLVLLTVSECSMCCSHWRNRLSCQDQMLWPELVIWPQAYKFCMNLYFSYLLTVKSADENAMWCSCWKYHLRW